MWAVNNFQGLGGLRVKAVQRTSSVSSSSSSSAYAFLSPRSSRSLHHSLLYNGLRSPTHPFFSLIKARPPLYVSFSSPSSVACQLYTEMPRRDGRLEQQPFYRVMDVVKSLAARPARAAVPAAHCWAFKMGALAHLPTSTSLLIAYSRVADFSSSWALFDEILSRDVILWNAMITASVENHCFWAAVNLFVELMREGFGLDSTTLLILVSASSHLGDLTLGRVFHGISFKTGSLEDSFLCNALIGMYAKCGELSSSECVFGGMECMDVSTWNSLMRGCIYSNYPEKSLWYFKQMARSREKADNITLTCAISAAALLRRLSTGQVIHGWGIKLGYRDVSHNSFENSLISLYAQCGDIGAAEILFKEMKCKDIISWNAMMDGFALDQRIWEAFDLLHEMQLVGPLQPDLVTVLTIIPLCAELMLLREGRAVHGFAIRREMVSLSEFSVTNSLIDMYSKCKDVKGAEHLFKAIPRGDLVSWNAMMSGYSQNGHSKEAQYLFKQLLQSYSQCSLSTLLAILPSCDSSEFLQFGKSIHCWQLKVGFANNTLAVNSLMLMYINCGDLAGCFTLLPTVSAAADIACWNTVVAGCTQNGYFWEALKAFDLMRQESNVCLESVTLFNVISACGNLELVSAGKSLHALTLKASMESDIRIQNALITLYGRCGSIEDARMIFGFSCNRNLCSWNCMISAFAQNKDGRRALELCRLIEFEPNEITLVAILSACTQLGLVRHGKEIHGHVIRSRLLDNSHISAALADMYTNCGRLDTALHIFQSSPERSIAAWNSMISGLGLHGQAEKAIELFHEMCQSGIRPTKCTFISLLSACSHSGLVDEGVRYYSYMLEWFDMEAETEHHVCIVDMLGRAGRLNEAYDFIRRLPTQPEPGVWGALLSACNYHGDLRMGRHVAEILFQLEPENVSYYVSLSNMYVAAGRWKDAVELREVIQDKGLKKPTAYSLIDVGMG